MVNDYPDNLRYIEANCPNFEFWQMDSAFVAKIAIKRGLKTDILFIDTVHTYEATRKEYAAWQPALSEGAVVMFDDLTRPGMPRFWDELAEPKLRIDNLHDGAGFGVKW